MSGRRHTPVGKKTRPCLLVVLCWSLGGVLPLSALIIYTRRGAAGALVVFLSYPFPPWRLVESRSRQFPLKAGTREARSRCQSERRCIKKKPTRRFLGLGRSDARTINQQEICGPQVKVHVDDVCQKAVRAFFCLSPFCPGTEMGSSASAFVHSRLPCFLVGCTREEKVRVDFI